MWNDLGVVRAEGPWEAIVLLAPWGGHYRAYPVEAELDTEFVVGGTTPA